MLIATNCSGTGSNDNWDALQQQTVVLDTTNLAFLRSVTISDDGVALSARANIVGLPLSEISRVLSNFLPNLTWPPTITAQSNSLLLDSSNMGAPAIFSIVAEDEFGRIDYQWRMSSDNGATYSNYSNSNATGATSNTLSLGNVLFPSLPRTLWYCVATNPSGAVASNAVLLSFNGEVFHTRNISGAVSMASLGARILNYTPAVVFPDILSWPEGATISITSTANTDNWMDGVIVAVDDTTVMINFTTKQGSGTYSDFVAQSPAMEHVILP